MRAIAAIGAALRERCPVDKLRPLYDHSDENVRLFAAIQFLGIDPVWATAAIGAVGQGLSTREVLALCERAKQPPPERPSLQDMSVVDLTARFEDAGIRKFATRFLAARTSLSMSSSRTQS